MIAGMTIGQVARRAGMRPSSIRFYEKAGVLPKPLRRCGQRRYDDSVFDRLALLQFAKACGFALAETRRLFGDFENEAPLAARLAGMAQQKIAELNARAEWIAAARARLERGLTCRCATLGDCGRSMARRRCSGAHEPHLT